MTHIAVTPSLAPQSSPTLQQLSWGTRAWNGLYRKFSWITNWKENILGVLAIYNLCYAAFLFISGYWLTAAIALFTAGFCSATRKDIRDFTDLRKQTKDYSAQNRAHFQENFRQKRLNDQYKLTNEEQKQLNQKYKLANEEQKQLNEAQQRITQQFANENQELRANCQKLQTQLGKFQQQLKQNQEQLTHLTDENSQYATLNQKHTQLLKSFDQASIKLQSELRSNSTEAAKELRTLLTQFKAQKSALEKASREKDTEQLKIFASFAQQVKQMNGKQLKELTDAAEKFQKTQAQLQQTTGKLEAMKEEVERLKGIVTQLDDAAKLNTETAKLNTETAKLNTETLDKPM